MKPQQPSTPLRSTPQPDECLVRRVRASLPTLGVIAMAIASSVVVALGGCASSAGIASSAQTLAPLSIGLDAAVTMPAFATDWWHGFGDAALTDLVERALADNPSLKVAQARLARAQAAVSGAQAADGPQVNGGLDVTRQRFSATSIYPPPLGGGIYTL